MTQFLIDAIGWVGSVEVILAYGLISYHRVTAKSLMYQLLNLSGGFFLIINTYYYGAYPSAIVNVVWLIIASGAIWKMIK